MLCVQIAEIHCIVVVPVPVPGGGEKVLRLCPPLIVSDAEIRHAVEVIGTILRALS